MKEFLVVVELWTDMSGRVGGCRCCPTLNINLEMNYWHAETCNLPECHQPLFDLIADLSVTGATTAKVGVGTLLHQKLFD
jgi:hypothetical protein